MKNVSIIVILLNLFSISCRTNAQEDRPSQKNFPEVQKQAADKVPTPSPNSRSDDLNLKIGIVDVNDDQIICLRIENDGLIENDSVKIVTSFFRSPQLIISANVEKKLSKSCAWQDSEAGENPEIKSYYSLKLSDEKIEKSDIGAGIAFVSDTQRSGMQNGVAFADLNKDGKDEYFRACTSNEGLHLTVWTGKPLKGKRIWHSYYYLGYDTEPTCKEKDFEEVEG